MANVYIRSLAGGSATGADWANAYTTLAATLTGTSAAGNDYWVSEDHNESTGAAVTLTCAGRSPMQRAVKDLSSAVGPKDVVAA